MATKILVSGGAGYIGSHMVRLLLKSDYQPVVFDNLSTGHKQLIPEGVVLVEGDLRNPEDLNRTFTEHKIDAVINFAGLIIVPESVEDPLKYYEHNVIGTTNMINACLKHGVDKFIFSSTAAVYGDPLVIPIKENEPTKPLNPYGHSKLMIEQILSDTSKAHDFRYIALRYFNACGAAADGTSGEWHEPETHLIPNILKFLTGEKDKFVYFGDDYDTPDGTCVRDYIHIEDLCDAHLLALKALESGAQSDVFNLGNGTGYSIKEIMSAVEQVTGITINAEVGPRRAGDSAKLIADSSKAQSALGWKPSRDLTTIVKSAWEWEQKVNKL